MRLSNNFYFFCVLYTTNWLNNIVTTTAQQLLPHISHMILWRLVFEVLESFERKFKFFLNSSKTWSKKTWATKERKQRRKRNPRKRRKNLHLDPLRCPLRPQTPRRIRNGKWNLARARALSKSSGEPTSKTDLRNSRQVNSSRECLPIIPLTYRVRIFWNCTINFV